MNRTTVVACLVAVLLPGCATHSAVRQLAEDLRGVHAELELLRRAQDDLSRRLLEVEAATLASQVRTEHLQATMAATVTDLERLVTQLDEAQEAIARMREELTEAVAAVPPLAPPAEAPEPPKGGRVASAETTYAAGLANFRGREYGQAVLDFLDVVTRHPSHVLTPSAQFLIGEAYYLQHDYRQALIEFQKVLDLGPTSSKVPEALVKLGLCHTQLREDLRAHEAWRRVVREFPRSPSAEQARTLLARRGPLRN